VQSFVLLTDDQTRVKLDDDQSSRVLHLHEAADYILDPNRLPVPYKSVRYLTDRICDAIFKQFRPLHRTKEVGDYRVLQTIGKNNLYTTLLAEHRLLSTQEHFLLKVYSFNIYTTPETRHKQKEWILRDANALHRLADHPNIAKAYTPFPWKDNQIVLPLEWIEGYSIRSLLDTGIEIEYSKKVDILCQT
jgi:serine/threonine protein kinase